MVKYISDRIGVLHLGYLVETGTTEEIFSNPIHPYTRSLLSAVPLPNPEIEKRRKSVAYDKDASGIDRVTAHHRLEIQEPRFMMISSRDTVFRNSWRTSGYIELCQSGVPRRHSKKESQ